MDKIERRFPKPQVAGSSPAASAHDAHDAELQQRLRSVVAQGLLPVLLACAAGEDAQPHDAEALEVLGLANTRLTDLGAEVAHQLAALRASGSLPPSSPRLRAPWSAVLVAAGRPSPYGASLLAWLRVPTMRQTCCARSCGSAVAGVVIGDDGAWWPACQSHRDNLRLLGHGALDRHLDGVPSLEVRDG